MRFRFARPAGTEGLPVIPEVPDYALSTIEGKNGIGKTLAARLLELVSGEHPFAALPKAWESLCTDLGRLDILIDGFASGEAVRCEFDSAHWQGRQESDCAADPGAAFIDDRPVSWDQVRALIQVRRVAGDEGLSETLGRSLREASVSAYERYRQADRAAHAVGTGIGLFTAGFAGVSYDGLVRERDELDAASQALTTAQAAFVAIDKSYGQVADVARQDRLLLASVTALPELMARYCEEYGRYAAAADNAEAVERRLAEAGRQQIVLKGKEAEYERWLGLLPRRTRDLRRAQFTEQQALARVGLAARIDHVEIMERIGALAAEIDDLEQQNRVADAAGVIRGLQEQFMPALQRLPETAQDLPIATLNSDLLRADVTVRDLAVGMSVRHEVLRGVPKPGDVQTREDEIRKRRVTLQWLQALPEMIRVTDRKRRNLDEAEQKLSQLSRAGVSQISLAEVQQLVTDARNALVAATVAARDTQAQIHIRLVGSHWADLDIPAATTQTGVDEDSEVLLEDTDDEADEAGGTDDDAEPGDPTPVEDLAARVEKWLYEAVRATTPAQADARVSAIQFAHDLDSRLAACAEIVQSELYQCEAQLAALSADRSSAESAKYAASTEREGAQRVLQARLDLLIAAARALTAPDGPWNPLLTGAAGVMQRLETDPATVASIAARGIAVTEIVDDPAGVGREAMRIAQVIDVIRQIAEEVENDAVVVRDGWATAAEYLNVASSSLAPRLSDNSYAIGSVRAQARPVLQAWAEQYLGSLLSAPELRRELFEGAREIAFSMRDLTVSWRSADDDARPRRRPLEAFSSGEQVFAYTRAKLEQLRSVRQGTKHLVVFLDEFGAFVARDRFAQLMGYIEHDALGDIADQIVVTVPLSGEFDRVVAFANASSANLHSYPQPGYVVIPSIVSSAR